jgi:hypothetical protein
VLSHFPVRVSSLVAYGFLHKNPLSAGTRKAAAERRIWWEHPDNRGTTTLRRGARRPSDYDAAPAGSFAATLWNVALALVPIA